jgi:hypothetical protein
MHLTIRSDCSEGWNRRGSWQWDHQAQADDDSEVQAIQTPGLRFGKQERSIGFCSSISLASSITNQHEDRHEGVIMD